MSAAQRERFDAWKVASFNRQAVKRVRPSARLPSLPQAPMLTPHPLPLRPTREQHITQTTSNTITDDMAQIIGGVAKVFVGQVMSTGASFLPLLARLLLVG